MVKFKDYLSNRETKTCGVSKGSVLGSLFLVYINDIYKCSRILPVVLFADDTNIFNSHKHLKVVNETLNNELVKVQVWYMLTNFL